MTSPTASQTRDEAAFIVRQLLLGPMADAEHLANLEGEADPTHFYLTGILWPRGETLAADQQDEKRGPAEQAGETGSEDESIPLFTVRRPASVGLTCAISGTTTPFTVLVSGARYRRIEDAESGVVWARDPFECSIEIPGDETRTRWKVDGPADAGGRRDPGIVVHVIRRIRGNTLLVTATLVNGSIGTNGAENCLFQTRVAVKAPGAITRRPPDTSIPDQDMESAALLFRHRHEYAVGHGSAASWDDEFDGRVSLAHTDWMPIQGVPAVSRTGHEDLGPLVSREPSPFAARLLADVSRREQTIAALNELCGLYGTWIARRRIDARKLDASFVDTAERHLSVCETAHKRMVLGVELLSEDDAIWRAFCLASEAMESQSTAKARGDRARTLVWYPFQIAFLLLALPSVAREDDPDRDTLDLLWFPTGGGKTEAYLGLTAFSIFLRRLRGLRDSPHVDVLMRYTLRLLTVQQFQRAAAMICAAELIRQRAPADLGELPITIGLYVGEGATPNKLLGGAESSSAKQKLDEERRGAKPNCTPRLLLECPICGAGLSAAQYILTEAPTPRLDVVCGAKECPFFRRGLGVFTVDEDVYRERPSLVIATVDKFAQLPRKDEVGFLFGCPDSVPPELIIQDELHLISGPLGTISGLYETAVDQLCTRNGRVPKVIGSTATIGRAELQVRALFDRRVMQFPPPGLTSDDSFFAVRDDKAPSRLYVGLSSIGRSPKFTLQAAAAAALVASDALLQRKHPVEQVDPYVTCLLYFNSLRELGGASVQMRDDVNRTSPIYALRLALARSRRVFSEPREINSRVPSTEIPRLLKDLEASLMTAKKKGPPIDVVLASNMISVGMDIPRLGMMLVNGQPKTMSEYIQATSRVGRSSPGLVFAIYNAARPRDVSHFEHFVHLHRTLYRRVEVTSVTPWSPRARDRALHAVYASAVRHIDGTMAGRAGATQFSPSSAAAKAARDWILRRVRNSGADDTRYAEVENELQAIVGRWAARAASARASGGVLEYWFRRGKFGAKALAPHLMRGAEDAAADLDGVWSTPNSMREVEPSAHYALWDQSPSENAPAKSNVARSGGGSQQVGGSAPGSRRGA